MKFYLQESTLVICSEAYDSADTSPWGLQDSTLPRGQSQETKQVSPWTAEPHIHRSGPAHSQPETTRFPSRLNLGEL